MNNLYLDISNLQTDHPEFSPLIKVIRRILTNRYIIFICFWILFSFPETVDAQYGIKIGTSVSNFYYTGDSPVPYNDYDIDLSPFLGYDIKSVQAEPQKPLLSLYISVYRSFQLTHKIGLRPELSYIEKGVNFSQHDYERIIYKVKINYLEIPLSAFYLLRQTENAEWEIYSGGYGALKLNAIKRVSTQSSEEVRQKVNSVKLFDGGLHLGANYKHRFYDDLLFVDLRIFMGLCNIFESPENWTSTYFETPKTKIIGLNLSVGYEF
jgi:Outer membrane protein beta-barrel domain